MANVNDKDDTKPFPMRKQQQGSDKQRKMKEKLFMLSHQREKAFISKSKT